MNKITTNREVTIQAEIINKLLAVFAEAKMPADDARAHMFVLSAGLLKSELTDTKQDPRSPEAKNAFMDSARRAWLDTPINFLSAPAKGPPEGVA